MSVPLLAVLKDSCVFNLLVSYMRNDSVLEISRHTDLFNSVLKLLHLFVTEVSLSPLVAQHLKLFDLAENMKRALEAYIQQTKPACDDKLLDSLTQILDSICSYSKRFLPSNTGQKSSNKVYYGCIFN